MGIEVVIIPRKKSFNPACGIPEMNTSLEVIPAIATNTAKLAFFINQRVEDGT